MYPSILWVSASSAQYGSIMLRGVSELRPYAKVSWPSLSRAGHIPRLQSESRPAGFIIVSIFSHCFTTCNRCSHLRVPDNMASSARRFCFLVLGTDSFFRYELSRRHIKAPGLPSCSASGQSNKKAATIRTEWRQYANPRIGSKHCAGL